MRATLLHSQWADRGYYRKDHICTALESIFAESAVHAGEAVTPCGVSVCLSARVVCLFKQQLCCWRGMQRWSHRVKLRSGYLRSVGRC